ncbi:cytochrome c5 family protein [Marinihelvus fidelis]|uniref:Cytochrome c5 family protein n=1 Tax=Marinihelvus fidelis TaxID=2613842 RepID=A0A5N0T8U0_9GAMM|nr:c-type cytochrome [Marinihelvus fidelis]KAA9131360.1 cytochrome c5 family protein [Marinihelvus fidelis]
MGNHEDKVFLKRFSIIILILVGITFAIIFMATRHGPEVDPADNPSRMALAVERTAPVGAVRTELPEGSDAVAAAPAPVDPASIDGEAVYAQVCGVCHNAGVAGAPIPGSDDWATRVEQGHDTLVDHAINGLNAMPPKGGRPDLSDAEVIAAVEHMLAQ